MFDHSEMFASATTRSVGRGVCLKAKKDGFKVSALTSPPTRLEPFSNAAQLAEG